MLVKLAPSIATTKRQWYLANMIAIPKKPYKWEVDAKNGRLLPVLQQKYTTRRATCHYFAIARYIIFLTLTPVRILAAYRVRWKNGNLNSVWNISHPWQYSNNQQLIMVIAGRYCMSRHSCVTTTKHNTHLSVVSPDLKLTLIKHKVQLFETLRYQQTVLSSPSNFSANLK